MKKLLTFTIITTILTINIAEARFGGARSFSSGRSSFSTSKSVSTSKPAATTTTTTSTSSSSSIVPWVLLGAVVLNDSEKEIIQTNFENGKCEELKEHKELQKACEEKKEKGVK